MFGIFPLKSDNQHAGASMMLLVPVCLCFNLAIDWVAPNNINQWSQPTKPKDSSVVASTATPSIPTKRTKSSSNRSRTLASSLSLSPLPRSVCLTLILLPRRKRAWRSRERPYDYSSSKSCLRKWFSILRISTHSGRDSSSRVSSLTGKPST